MRYAHAESTLPVFCELVAIYLKHLKNDKPRASAGISWWTAAIAAVRMVK
jgi:hypothetical protein